jgi:hypothetical protein
MRMASFFFHGVFTINFEQWLAKGWCVASRTIEAFLCNVAAGLAEFL